MTNPRHAGCFAQTAFRSSLRNVISGTRAWEITASGPGAVPADLSPGVSGGRLAPVESTCSIRAKPWKSFQISTASFVSGEPVIAAGISARTPRWRGGAPDRPPDGSARGRIGERPRRRRGGGKCPAAGRRRGGRPASSPRGFAPFHVANPPSSRADLRAGRGGGPS